MQSLLDATPRARYKAESQPSGEVVVYDLPLFAEVREGDPGGRPPRDRAWLERALAACHARAARDYFGPIHFEHHGDGVVDPAGTFRLTRVGLIDVNPDEDPRACLFGDLVFRDRASFERWRDGYAYRSVELSRDYPDEVGSVALLDDAAPYWRFPNTGPQNVEEFSASAGLDQLWRSSMDDEKSEGEKPTEKAEPAPAAAPAMPTPEPEAPGYFRQFAATCMDYNSKSLSALEKIYSAISGKAMGDGPGTGGGSATPAVTGASAAPGESFADGAADPRLLGEIHGLRRELESIKAEKAQEKAAARVLDAFAARGPLTERDRVEADRVAKLPVAAIEAYMAGLDRGQPVAAPRRQPVGPAGFLSGLPGAPAGSRKVLESAVSKLMAKGDAETARALAESYRQIEAEDERRPEAKRRLRDERGQRLVVESFLAEVESEERSLSGVPLWPNAAKNGRA